MSVGPYLILMQDLMNHPRIARLSEWPDTDFYLLTDSRRLSFPEQTLFFALRTATNDGHRYLQQLYDLRVRHFVVQQLPDHCQERFPEATFFLEEDPLEALQQLASRHREGLRLPFVGITGSNGKTTTKEFLYQLLQADIHLGRSPRSYNSQIGVPLSIWQIRPEHELALIEAGISQPGEMQRLQSIIRPDIGLFTGLGSAHQENFDSLEQKAIEKLQLFRHCRHLVLCQDDPMVMDLLQRLHLKDAAFCWSRLDPQAPVFVLQQTQHSAPDSGKTGTDLTLIIHQTRTVTLSIPFTDAGSINDILHAITLITCLKGQDSAADYLLSCSERFRSLEPVAMRMEVKQGRNNCLIINDTYNSDLQSLSIALDFLQSRKKSEAMPTALILSDIIQSGMPERVLYHKVAQLVASKGIRRVIGIGPALTACQDLFPMEISCYPNTEALLNSDRLQDFHQELILVKGARQFHFERITERLEKKIHETILEVNLDALVHNFNHYRSRLDPRTKIICMVKAHGYGAGSYELARTLQEHHCDYLAVAVADEGVALRKEGITLPILVMNPEFNSFNILFEYNLEPEVYSFRLLEGLITKAREQGIHHFPIHLKFDTGMHRLGFQQGDVPALLRRFRDLSQETDNGKLPLTITSVFSHLAGSDSAEFDDFTATQIDRFSHIANELEAGLGHPVLKHILNSAGIERWNRYQFDMVRLGIGLYGVSASGQAGLRNVSTLKTTILQIQQVPCGDTIGYSRRTRVQRDSRIAIIPIGYADGLDRHLSNGQGQVLIQGKRCPIVGNICMDTCMIDVTDTQAREGDTVVLFGGELHVDELARQLGTIPYEILTSVSARVKRIYYRE